MTIQARVPTAALHLSEPSPGTEAPTTDPERLRRRISRAVWFVAVAAAVLRIPYLEAPMSPDEGGFLVVAQHWHAGGGSLYGPYWVDRPPLLIAVFRLADAFGGLTALRVIGCVVVALTVLGVAFAAASAAPDARASRRASLWSALVVAGLLVTPVGGAVMVNGELLAAPFIAFGVALALRALRDATGWAGRGRGADLAALGAGVCAVAAAMVKQNMIDVVVFAVVLGLVAGVRRLVAVRVLLRRALLAAVAGLVAFALVLAGALTRGTTPGALYFAMYPFRLRASRVMAHESQVSRMHHLRHMLHSWVASGAPIVVVAFLAVVVAVVLVTILRRRPAPSRFPGPVVVAVLVTAAYDVVSIWAGGSFWNHYVLQLVVPVGLMVAVVVATVPRTGRLVAVLAVAAAMVAWGLGFTASVSAAGVTVGEAIGDAALPSDTVVSVLGDGVLVRTSDLQSPYRYLWSLPAHVLDHRFARLTSLLDASDRPSWVVVRRSGSTRKILRLGPGQALQANYTDVGTICGRTVYLRDGLTRPVPEASGRCWFPLVSWDPDRATHHWSVTEGELPWSARLRAH